MFGILARLLEVLYSVWPSYGGSIVLFTLVVMLLLTPLTLKGTRSMLAMQALQPEMKKLQARYKDDRQKLNEEMMKFYQENKISPVGGCLPMLIQLPVFFILYEVLLGLTRRGPYGQDLGTSVACHLQNGAGCVNNVFTHAGFFAPKYLKSSSRLFQDLTHSRAMGSWGLDLSQSPLKALGSGVGHALPYVLMVLVVVGLTYVQQVQLQSRAPKSSINPTQQLTMKIMPVAMGVIYLVIPAGVVVYFLVSSLFRIGQQALVTRTFYTGPNAIAIPATAVETPVTEGGKKKFFDQFKPSPEAMPQIGKRSGGDGSGSATSSNGGTSTKGKPSATNKKNAQKNAPKKATTKADDAEVAPDASEAARAPTSRSTPSRKAPASTPPRRGPAKPAAGTKKKKN